MSATYRIVQSSFQAGELDPMTAANYNLAYRQIGLKESYNTLHLPNATVSKRPGLLKELFDNSFGDIASHDSWTVIELQTESGSTCGLFLGKTARILYEGAFYDRPIYGSAAMDEKDTISLTDGEKHYSSVFQQTVFITDSMAEHGFYALQLTVSDEGIPDIHRVDSSVVYDDISDMGNASTLAVANGRLWIADRNILAASRSRTIDLKQDENGFPKWMMDFTLTDYSSTAVYSYHREDAQKDAAIDEKVYYRCTGKDLPADPFDTPDCIEKRVRQISVPASDIANKDTEYSTSATADEPAYDRVSIDLAYRDDYTVTENYSEGSPLITDISRKRSVIEGFIQLDIARGMDIKYDTSMQDDGYICIRIPYGTDKEDEICAGYDGSAISGWIVLNKSTGTDRHELDSSSIGQGFVQKDAEGVISYKVTIGASMQGSSYSKTLIDHPASFPEMEAYPDTEDGISNPVSSESTPSVYSTHGIQIQENDMYGSSIRWIASAGRLIVGTDAAVFMAVDQYADPSTFDLVITSYTGTSDIQPKVLNQFIVFTSLDRKKLYVGLYSDEMKGLQISEATEHVTHMFLSGIRDYYITDTPYRAIYVITNDGDCRVCIPTATADGIVFAWSTWDFGPAKAEYIAFDRRHRKTFLVMNMNGNGYVYTLDYREPYLYGESDVALLLDYAEVTEAKNQAQTILIDNPMLVSAGKLQMMCTYPDGRSIVYRDVGMVMLNDKHYVRYLPPAGITTGTYPSDADVVIRIGMAYETRIALYQQMLPNNSGYSLISKHSIERIYLAIFRSQGGSIWHGSTKVKDILQLVFGRDRYNSNGTDPETGKPYSFTGIYSVDDPVQTENEDSIMIISEDPYPLNIMAVGFRYKLTELN